MFNIKVFLSWTVFSCFCILIIGCEKLAPKAAYIQINKISLIAEKETQGTDSAAINTAWIYIDDNPVGVFEIPAKVPVTRLGEVKLTIIPGVKANGISSTRVQYSVLDNIIYNISLFEDSTTVVYPTTKYSSTAKFPFKENFEDPGLSFETTSISGTGITISKTSNPDEVYEGSGSGKIKMISGQDFFEMANTQSLDLPYDGTPVFLEMNFKSNNDIRMGIYAKGTSGEVQKQVLGLNPTINEATGDYEWRKVYILLTPTLQSYIGGSYKLYFGIVRNASSPEVIEVYFDNFKIVYP